MISIKGTVALRYGLIFPLSVKLAYFQMNSNEIYVFYPCLPALWYLIGWRFCSFCRKAFCPGLDNFVFQILLQGAYAKPSHRCPVPGFFTGLLRQVNLPRSPIKKAFPLLWKGLVPRTGFEPAHPCERCDLNTVRLPISPPGHH